MSHAFELWDKLFAYFQKQTSGKACHLLVELRTTTLENCTVKEYLLKICTIVDSLASIGDSILMNQHIDVILEGLPQDYSSVMSFDENKFELMDIDEVKALLITHELCLEKYKKKTLVDTASLNLKHTPSPSPQSASNFPSPQTKVSSCTP